MNLKELSFYEQAAVIIPGSVFVFGLLLLLPELRPLFAEKGITIGGLGLFLVIAYALGHLIATAGNILETAIWWPCGGMPSSWVRAPGKLRLLTAKQHEVMLKKINARHEIGLAALQGVPKAEWRGHFDQIYCDVRKNGTTPRLETMLGNYGLNRGLAAALLILLITAAFRKPAHEPWYLVALGVAFVGYTLRMARFGLYWAREVYLAFLLLPDQIGPPAAAPSAPAATPPIAGSRA